MKPWNMIVLGVILLTLLLAACGPATPAEVGETVEPGATEAVAAETTAPLPETGPTEAAATTVAATEAIPTEAAATTAPGAGAGGCALTQEEEQQLVSTGKEIYTSTCTACHGAQGEGQGNFPALANNPEVTTEEPSELIQVMKNPQVHPFANNLTDEQIAAALTYVRNAFGNQASAICPEQVSTAAQ